ncbi:hypothetical protein [Mogibacterium pumilum]|uniref:Uncharacterized protein n=1 Tax=Mogibacterium pumilum TaxID=86332 RepID=A0A223AQA1_9FIRM|nr:hypothetical protein [Mogibacterium pumilum]ASS37132.1 hypothetical protein AXF17_00685 [Mogibacterium pumilum]
MSITDKVNGRGNVNRIVLITTILFLVFTAFSSIYTYADGTGIALDPESISGEHGKEGNVLSQYGFAVFTDESMARMKDIKEKKKADQKQMVSNLFAVDWQGTGSYDKEVRDTINEGKLFTKVNTGVESDSKISHIGIDTMKVINAFIVGTMMCLISVIFIRWRRKKHENIHNNRAR